MNKPTLEELLKQLRQEAELISVEEVRKQVMLHPVDEKVVSRKSQLLKWTIMTTTIFITGLIIWGSGLFSPSEKQVEAGAFPPINLYVPQQDQVFKIKPDIALTGNFQRYLLPEGDTVKRDSAHSQVTFTTEINDGNFPGDKAITFTIDQNPMERNWVAECRPMPPLFRPDSSTLRKLGIVMNEGILVFEQKNTVFHGDLMIMLDRNTNTSKMKSENRTFFNLSGSGNKLVPEFITDCTGECQFTNDRNKTLETESQNLVCFLVTDEGHKIFYQFWYSPHKDLFDILGVSENEPFLKSRYEKPVPVEIPQLKPGRNWIPKNLANNAQWIRGSEPMLKKLGIKEEDDKIEFKRGTTKVTIDNMVTNVRTVVTVSPERQLKETDINKVMPLFITDVFYLSKSSAGTSLTAGPSDGMYTPLSDDAIDIVSFVSTDHHQLAKMEAFFSMKEQLIAIEVGVQRPRLMWYAMSPALKELLDAEIVARLETYQAKNTSDLPFKFTGKRPEFKDLEGLFATEQPTAEALRALELNPAELKTLGIEIVDKQVLHHQYYSLNANVTDALYTKKFSSTSWSDVRDTINPLVMQEKWIRANKALWFVTDDLGSNYLMYSQHNDRQLELKNLIPVLVRTGEKYTLKDKLDGMRRPDVIFWYEPTEEFLNLLPPGVASDIRKSLHSVKSFRDLQVAQVSSDSASCRYVEACKNRKGVISDYKLYPNPATNKVFIELTVVDEMTVDMELFSVNGGRVKMYSPVLVSKENNILNLETDNLTPGIYLLVIRSDKGDIIHERLVITDR